MSSLFHLEFESESDVDSKMEIIKSMTMPQFACVCVLRYLICLLFLSIANAVALCETLVEY